MEKAVKKGFPFLPLFDILIKSVRSFQGVKVHSLGRLGREAAVWQIHRYEEE